MDSIEEGIDSFLLPEAKNRLRKALHEINERLLCEFRGNVSRNVSSTLPLFQIVSFFQNDDKDMEIGSKLLIDLKDYAKSTLFELNRNVIRGELGLLLESLPHREPLLFREELIVFEHILRACPELSDAFKDLILNTTSKLFDSIKEVFMPSQILA